METKSLLSGVQKYEKYAHHISSLENVILERGAWSDVINPSRNFAHLELHRGVGLYVSTGPENIS